LQDLAKGLQELHVANIFHLDVKLLNALRVNGRIAVIDMDASGTHEQYAGAKFSSGVLPPEMFRQLDDNQLQQYKEYWAAVNPPPELWKKIKPRRTKKGTFVVKCFDENAIEISTNIKKLPYDLIRPSAAIDAWAFGVLMFQLLCRKPFVAVDAEDDLVDVESYLKAATWTDAKLAEYIEESMEQYRGYGDAIDILKELLRVDANNRLKSMNDILHLLFFQTDNVKHLARRFETWHNESIGLLNIVINKIDEVKEISTKVYSQIRVTEKILLRGIFEKPAAPNCFVILPVRISPEEIATEKTSEWLGKLG
jgi:serine/threonine protein kinase